MMTHAERMARGQRAKELLENELIVEAFEKLEASYFTAWKNAKTAEDRENVHRYWVNLAGLKGQLNSVITEGKVADKTIREMEGRPTLLDKYR